MLFFHLLPIPFRKKLFQLCNFFIEVSVYWALLNWRKQCIARYLIVQTCPHCCISQKWNAGDEFGRRCSNRNANHAPMFLQFVHSKSDIIKMRKYATIDSYFWKEEKWICGVQDEVFLLLKIGSKLAQRLF